MKATGMVRPIDALGRIVLPMELRERFDLKAKDPMEIFVDGDRIVLRKYQPSCVFCGENEDVTYYRDKLVCKKCVEALKLITG